MLRGIGVRRRQFHRRRGRRHHRHWLAASLAELRGELVGRAAAGTNHFQPRPTLLTKHGVSGALVLTPRTLHAAPPVNRAALKAPPTIARAWRRRQRAHPCLEVLWRWRGNGPRNCAILRGRIEISRRPARSSDGTVILCSELPGGDV